MSQEQKKIFLNVGIKKGTFYLSSETQVDDTWEKNEFTISKKDFVRYHKPVTINGKLTKVKLSDDKFKGQCLTLMVDDGENISVVDLPVYQPNSKYKTTDSYFQSAVGALESINLGDTIGIIVNNRAKDKKGELYKNLVFFTEDKQLIKSLYDFTDVPRWAEVR